MQMQDQEKGPRVAAVLDVSDMHNGVQGMRQPGAREVHWLEFPPSKLDVRIFRTRFLK